MTNIVNHYGVHWTCEGVAYLHQASGKSENFIRLAEKSPFDVECKGKCPHSIMPGAPIPDRAHWELFLEAFQDELIQELLPIPRQQSRPIPFISDCDEMLLVLLSKMSSPIRPVVIRFDQLKNYEELALTNACPLILTALEPKDQSAMEVTAKLARRSPRRVLFQGSPNMVITTPIKRIQTNLEDYDQTALYSLPMENLGAVALRRWARNEQVDAPWTR